MWESMAISFNAGATMELDVGDINVKRELDIELNLF
jgi:hypothetical protein